MQSSPPVVQLDASTTADATASAGLWRFAEPLEIAARVLLGFVLLLSAFAHLGNPYFFLTSVYQYQLVSPRVGQLAAMMLPMLLVGICLVARVMVGGALILASALLAVFMSAQAWAYANGLNMSCGCFGSSTEMVGASTLVRVAAIFGIAVIALVLHVAIDRRTLPQSRSAADERNPSIAR
ncbi:MAG TPA: MauE/DoxX family redox-associated membrane protein [Pirellulales bacterium]|nr:MauE/DoxX family redox-associated membrane protein [Pirellulales bacterium]